MSHILTIDTSSNNGTISLLENGIALLSMTNETINDHAIWLHTAIQQLMSDTNFSLSKLDAIAVAIGPGSYTGLRVALSSAKGLCFALNKPLITINNLEIIAVASQKEAKELEADYICPMIDARRMEVFTALYSVDLKEKEAPSSLIITEHSFEDVLQNHKILFTGNGHLKCKPIISQRNALYSNIERFSTGLTILAQDKFENSEYADLMYVEPFYIKEFYNNSIGYK